MDQRTRYVVDRVQGTETDDQVERAIDRRLLVVFERIDRPDRLGLRRQRSPRQPGRIAGEQRGVGAEVHEGEPLLQIFGHRLEDEIGRPVTALLRERPAPARAPPVRREYLRNAGCRHVPALPGLPSRCKSDSIAG